MRTAASYRQLAEITQIAAAREPDPKKRSELEAILVEFKKLAEEAERQGIQPQSDAAMRWP